MRRLVLSTTLAQRSLAGCHPLGTPIGGHIPVGGEEGGPGGGVEVTEVVMEEEVE